MIKLKEKLIEMLAKDLSKDEEHALTMELFSHHMYTKEAAYMEGYKAAIEEIAKFLQNIYPSS